MVQFNFLKLLVTYLLKKIDFGMTIVDMTGTPPPTEYIISTLGIPVSWWMDKTF